MIRFWFFIFMLGWWRIYDATLFFSNGLVGTIFGVCFFSSVHLSQLSSLWIFKVFDFDCYDLWIYFMIFNCSICEFISQFFDAHKFGPKAIGLQCSSLRSFTFIKHDTISGVGNGNDYLVAIAKVMPNLVHLRLGFFGSTITNKGYQAILDGCPIVESLVRNHINCDSLSLSEYWICSCS